MRPCHADHALSPGTCRLCWLCANDPAYRQLWGEPQAGTLTPDRLSQPCIHRGAAVLRQELCPSCRGRVSLKVFACSVHGECTIAKPLGKLACCALCADYQSQPASKR
jgi:hypothetical protein